MRCWSDAIASRVLSTVLVSWFLPGDCSIAAQPNKVRISYSSRSNSNTPFIIALNKGFFVEEGIDVELIQVNPRLGGDEKKLICRSLARFGASVFFFLEKIQLRRYYSGANR
jgi:hypothetical protein